MSLLEKKTYKKSFRCTEDENNFILTQANSFHSSESEFMRMMIFEKSRNKFFDPDILEQVKRLEYSNLKIGNNINQIVKSCNSKKFVLDEDVAELIKFLNLINYKYDLLISNLQKIQG